MHQFVHILLRPMEYDRPVSLTPEEMEIESRALPRLLATEVAEEPEVPFEGHGLIFIRIALHLRHRAELAGTWIVAPNDLCAGWRYGLSHARRYEVALSDEPKQMTGKSAFEIVAAKPPDPFSQLWDDDVFAHFQFRSYFTNGGTV